MIERDKRLRISQTDRLLRKFDYRSALDSVLKFREIAPAKVISLIIELARRDGLKIALSNRDGSEITPILSFVVG